MMKHPSEAVLALFAGGELGNWRRWSVRRHVAACPECRREVSDFSALREEVSAMSQLPDISSHQPNISWTKMAAEMRANIRLGLEAGECVSPQRPAARGIFSVRALAVCGSLALLLMAFLLERPTPRVDELKAPEASFLESSGSGIQVKEGGQAMMLLHPRARDVSYLASGNAMRARYVDTETGYVTINNVYAQ
jgi:anti-sigma factor RsiW